MDLEEIEGEVRRGLSEGRLYHSKCVMDKCGELAVKYNVDVETAMKVGIAHDIAKEMTAEEKIEYARLNNIEIDDVEKKFPGLLHTKVGADIAVQRFGFTDQMAKAIEAHSTGKENMDMLAKVLYIADWIGLDRNYSDTQYLRELVEEDIDVAIIYSLEQIVKEKFEKKEEIHIDTILARNYLLNKKIINK